MMVANEPRKTKRHVVRVYEKKIVLLLLWMPVAVLLNNCKRTAAFTSVPVSSFVSSDRGSWFLKHPRREHKHTGTLRTSVRLQNQWQDDSMEDDNNVSKRTTMVSSVPSEAAIAASDASSSQYQVSQLEKFARLPVWPVWMGVIIFFISRVFGNEIAAKVEDSVGGRVCPQFFNDKETSPFIMLVHHRHSFWNWDLIRYIQRAFILPEGFPSHPHRGFTTLTYFMKGGFQHRDSIGIAQQYGAEDNQKFHSQWLFTGAGLLHEEMFLPDITDHELYQLWINVPSKNKLQPPDVVLLGPEEAPEIISSDGTSKTVVLAGEYRDDDDAGITKTSKAPIMSDMSIFHVEIQPNSVWNCRIPKSFQTIVLYVRKGSLQINGVAVPVHHNAYLGPSAPYSSTAAADLLQITTASDAVDFFFLAGVPLREPVSAQGSMVMNDPNEINQAYMDYQLGKMGKPWDHKLSDIEWKQHLQQYRSQYLYSNNNDDNSNTKSI